MKYCPTCQLKYADETYEFCLQDGTLLVEISTSQMPTVALNETENIAGNYPQNLPEKQNWQQDQITRVSNLPAAPQKSNTGLTVLLTAGGMFLIFSLGLGMWLYSGNRQPEVIQIKNVNAPNNNSSISSSASPNVADKPSSTSVTSENLPKMTPTPAPDFNPEQIKTEISNVIYAWKSLAESHNLDAYMNNYADTVDYYKKRGASRSFVRSDKQRYFTMYDSIKSSFSNMRIMPGETGETAIVVFDKEWVNQGADKYSEGKIQSQLQLVKSGSKWLIRGEKDLKIYYIGK
jgi:hypothetical protein